MQSTLNINDLSISKELDHEELAAVRGGVGDGSNYLAFASGGYGIGNPGIATNNSQNIDASTHLDLNLQTVNANSFFGDANAAAFKLR